MFDELVTAIVNCDVKMPNLLYLHLSALNSLQHFSLVSHGLEKHIATLLE